MHTVWRTNHTSLRQTHQKHTADLRSVSQNPIHQLAIGVFSGTGLLDMLDSARHAIKTKTQKSESVSLANSVKAFQKDVSDLLVTVSFSSGEQTIFQVCSNPDPETAFNVVVRKRCAEVRVSTWSGEQKRELENTKEKELNTIVKYPVVDSASRQGVSSSAAGESLKGQKGIGRLFSRNIRFCLVGACEWAETTAPPWAVRHRGKGLPSVRGCTCLFGRGE